jgi:transposase-like protein
MSIVVLKLPDVKRQTETRPRECPYCQGETFQRWGAVTKAVRDPQVRSVKVYRYRCCHCHRTFRHYPPGVDQADQTKRMRKLAALCWALGLSYRSITGILAAFGIQLSRMTAWRDVQALAQEVQQARRWQQVRVLGVDGAYVRGWGDTQPVVVAVDLGTGQPVALGHVDEWDPQALRRFLEPLIKRLGVSVIVSDDLGTYRSVAEQLEVEHQICQFHVRRWVGRSLHALKETIPETWLWVLDEIKTLLADLPPQGSRRLFELWKLVPPQRTGRDEPLEPLDKLRLLLIRLSQHWNHYRVFDWHKEVPWTNNITEQVIGKMKVRSRTVRGYKSRSGLLNGLLVSASITC